MRKFLSSIIITLLMAAVSFASDAVPGDVIVVLRNTSGSRISSLSQSGGIKSLSAVQSFTKSSNVSIKSTYDALSEQGDYMFMLVHSDTKDENTLLREIKSRPDVIAASLNRTSKLLGDIKTPNDPQYWQLWGMEAINAPYAWNFSTGSDDVYVAVIDSGVDYEHEDLRDNFSHEYSRNFVGYGTADYDPSAYQDVNDHGSHVSGTIAAVGNNGKGVAGINWKAKIISLRVGGSRGEVYDSSLIAALDYLVSLLRNNPAMKIAATNCSFGGWELESPEEFTSYPFALAFKALSDTDRTVICAAAGNENHEVGVPAPNDDEENRILRGQYCYPPSLPNIDNMIVIAASRSSLESADFTNYSRNYVDIAAPGDYIYSTVRTNGSTDIGYDVIGRVEAYDKFSGTSMAAPHVAGAAALLKAIYPDAKVSEIKAAIIGGADGDHLRDDGTSMYGHLDLKGAIDFMAACRSKNTPPSITNAVTHEGVVNQSYALDLYASGTSPITWSIEGDLPEGLIFRDGKISGTPTKEGSSSFIVTAENDYGYDSLFLTMSIDKGAAPVISADEPPEFPVNSPVKFALDAEGSWPITWKLESSDFPESFKFDFNESIGAGALSPDVAGTYSLTVTASNYAGSDTRTFLFTFTEPEHKAPVILTDSLKPAIRGLNYGITKADDFTDFENALETLISSDSDVEVSWDVKGLPEGMTFSRENEYSINLEGIPTVSGSFDVHVIASNDYGIDSRDYVLRVVNVAPTFDSSSYNAEFSRGVYDNSRSRVFGSAPMSFDVVGELPKGISASFGRITAMISGTPEETGTFRITVYATNSEGTARFDATITVTEPARITTNLLPDALKGKPYTFKMSSLYDVPLTWSVIRGEIPGLSLSVSGDITGIPTEAGTFSVNILASKPENVDVLSVKAYSLTVREVPSISTSSLPDGKAGTPYDSVSLNAEGSSPITWKLSGGTMPAGLVLSSNGYINGTPSEAGTFAFALDAVNKAGNDSKVFTVRIAPSDPEDPESPDKPVPESPDKPVPEPLDLPIVKPVIKQGEARDVSSLTVGELSQVTANGSMIGAILPEVSVNVSGLYTFESVDAFANVKISPDVPQGYALVWNAFTRDSNVASMNDAADDFAVFYDADGREITTVPANHTVNVSAWLDEGKTYAPVISAVQSDDVGSVGRSSGGCNSGWVLLAVMVMTILSIKRITWYNC